MLKNFLLITLLVIISFKVSALETLCTTKRLNFLRAKPSTKSDIIKKLPMYTPLKVNQKFKSWYFVTGINYKGWIHKSIVSTKVSCMLLTSYSSPSCPGRENLPQAIKFREGFRVLKKDFGCNLVRNTRGQKLWLDSSYVWPTESSKSFGILD